ncbi:Nuf2 [Cardiosporidium cionae]|uniref:Nuf2 n=1 Tax=Cardiosporidium cionae TaxID=476202 RepID=A0ABQ7J7P6_9APIC|nr:Nuf2 [Cardiosporidium cionae]|eukprot:KAF8820010.1 Nuf2 [Cardiosporidium cionae]
MPNRVATPMRSKRSSNKMSNELPSAVNLGWNSASPSLLANAANLTVSHSIVHPSSFYYFANGSTTSSLHSNIFERQSIEDMEKEFEKLAIEIPSNFWKNPKSEDIHGLYSIALEEVFNLKLHDIRSEEVTGELFQPSPAYSNMHILSYDGRLHLRALGNLKFFRYCQRLCWHVLGIPNFNRDFLFKPTPTTVISFATAFVTFLKFREMVYTEHSEQFQEMNKKADGDSRLDDNLRMLQIDLNQFQSHMEQMQSDIFQCREEYSDLIGKLQGVSTEYIEMKKQSSSIHEKLTYITNNEKDISLKLAKLHYQRDALKDQIVPSPEKLMQRNAEIKQQIEHVFKALHSNEGILQKCMETLRLIEKGKKRLLKTEEMLQFKSGPLLQTILSGHATVKSHRSKLITTKEEEERLLRQGESLDQTLIHLQTLLQERQREWEARIDEAQEELRQAQLRLKQRKEALHIQSNATEALHVEAKQLVSQIHSLTEKHGLVLEHMDECIQNLTNCNTAFMTELQKLRDALLISPDSPSNRSTPLSHTIKREVIVDVDENQFGSLNQTNPGFRCPPLSQGETIFSHSVPFPRL